MNPAGLQVRHVHVEGRKAGALEGRRHLGLGIHPLLAQDGDLRPGAGANQRRGHVLGGVEARGHHDAGVVRFGQGGELRFSAGRVVSQAGDVVAGLAPGLEQLAAPGPELELGIAPQADLVAVVGLTHEVVGQAGLPQRLGDLRAVVAADLQHGAQLLAKQALEDVVAEAALEGVGLLFQAIHVVHEDVVADGVQHHREAAMGSEGHLAQGGEQAAVAPVVVGQKQALAPEALDQGEELGEVRGIDVRRLFAHGIVGLGED